MHNQYTTGVIASPEKQSHILNGHQCIYLFSRNNLLKNTITLLYAQPK